MAIARTNWAPPLCYGEGFGLTTVNGLSFCPEAANLARPGTEGEPGLAALGTALGPYVDDQNAVFGATARWHGETYLALRRDGASRLLQSFVIRHSRRVVWLVALAIGECS